MKHATPQLAPDAREGVLELQTCDSVPELERIAAEWNRLAQEADADIYFTPDWLRVWWRHYGAGRRLLVVLFRLSDRLVAALPFCIEERGLGPLLLRIARLANVDPNYAYINLPVLPELQESVLEASFTHLFRVEACDLISLSPASAFGTVVSDIRSACDATPAMSLIRDRSRRTHTVMRLPETFDAYLASLKKSHRKEYRKDLKRLSEQVELTTVMSTGFQGIGRYDEFVRLHTLQWQAAGRSGHFVDWPRSEAFYRELLARLPGRVRVEELIGGGQVLSVQYCFAFARRCYWRLTARTVDPSLQRFGVGRVGLVSRVHNLISEKVQLVEAGAGHYDYKLAFGGEEVAMFNIVVAPASFTRRMIAACFLYWSDLIDLVYYRIWFLKCAPRLGITGRALWQGWIRTRY